VISTKAVKNPIYGDLNAEMEFDPLTLEFDEKALKSVFTNFREGEYKDAFPELATATVGMESLKFSDVVSRLHDMQGKGDQNIEVFGLKLPSAEISRWGLALLLAIQFYFWLHLHELGRKIETSSPGWDVAWIGMYNSLAANLTMLISACILPLSAVSLLAFKLLPINRPEHKLMYWVLSLSAILISAVLAIATGSRLRAIKSNRISGEASVPTVEISNPS